MYDLDPLVTDCTPFSRVDLVRGWILDFQYLGEVLDQFSFAVIEIGLGNSRKLVKRGQPLCRPYVDGGEDTSVMSGRWTPPRGSSCRPHVCPRTESKPGSDFGESNGYGTTPSRLE